MTVKVKLDDSCGGGGGEGKNEMMKSRSSCSSH